MWDRLINPEVDIHIIYKEREGSKYNVHILTYRLKQ